MGKKKKTDKPVFWTNSPNFGGMTEQEFAETIAGMIAGSLGPNPFAQPPRAYAETCREAWTRTMAQSPKFRNAIYITIPCGDDQCGTQNAYGMAVDTDGDITFLFVDGHANRSAFLSMTPENAKQFCNRLGETIAAAEQVSSKEK